MYFLSTEQIKQTAEQATLTADVINEYGGLQVECRKLVESCCFNNGWTYNFSLCIKSGLLIAMSDERRDERRDDRVFWELLSSCAGAFSS